MAGSVPMGDVSKELAPTVAWSILGAKDSGTRPGAVPQFGTIAARMDGVASAVKDDNEAAAGGRMTSVSEAKEIMAVGKMELEPAEIIPVPGNGLPSAVNGQDEAALAGRITSESEPEEIAPIG